MKFETLVRAALFLQVGLALFVGAAYWAGLSMFSDGDAESRKVTAFLWGFAVLLFTAGRRLPHDPRWILPVLAVVVLNGIESAYEIVVRGDGDFVPALAVEGALGLLYAAYAARRVGAEARSRTPAARRGQPAAGPR